MHHVSEAAKAYVGKNGLARILVHMEYGANRFPDIVLGQRRLAPFSILTKI